MTEEKLQKALAALHTWAQENTWTLLREKELPTGRQVLVTDGNIQVQGAPSPLRDA
ncbi:MAG: hypothetical protein JO202_02905 [Ktedonobacteraceae bacterium]|nr:hypothetical protein [Ktedonobacteraceae bacterium]